jgi:hypothetical protein
MKTAAALACLLLTGCAGSILSHKPYSLPAGRVVAASPKAVVTEWPRDRWYFCGPDGASLCVGDDRPNVCPDTVPAKGTSFNRAHVTWDKARKCWKWESQSVVSCARSTITALIASG